MHQNNKFEIKRLTNELIGDYIEVFKKSFNEEIKPAHFYKVFGKKDMYLGYIAYDKNKPVAFFGLIVFNFWFKEETILAAQSISTMVIPEYRKDDLIICRQLSKSTYNQAMCEGIKFIYGWPNNAIFTKRVLCFTDLGRMKKISFKVKTFPLAKIAWRFIFLRNIYRKSLLLFLNHLITNDYKNFKFKNKTDNIYFIKGDADYMKYKAALGSFVLNLNKVNIWLNFDFRIKIGDIEDIDYNGLVLIIKRLKTIAFWAGINEIVFMVDRNSHWINIFEKTKATISDSFNLMYIPLNEKYTLEYASFTMGDFDTF